MTIWYSRYQPLTGLAWHTVFRGIYNLWFKPLRSDMRYAPGIQSVENKTVHYVYSSFLAKHWPERYQSWSITETQGQNSHRPGQLCQKDLNPCSHVSYCTNGRPAGMAARAVTKLQNLARTCDRESSTRECMLMMLEDR